MKGHHSGEKSSKADTIHWVAQEVTKCVIQKNYFEKINQQTAVSFSLNLDVAFSEFLFYRFTLVDLPLFVSLLRIFLSLATIMLILCFHFSKFIFQREVFHSSPFI